MKVLTIKNPHAANIFHDCKDVENRTWRTSYRGLLAIHVATKPADGTPVGQFPTCPEGHIVGVVELIEITEPGDLFDMASPWAMADHFHWRLANPRLLSTPIPARGQLWMWDIDDTQVLSHLNPETPLHEELKCPDQNSEQKPDAVD